MTERMINYITQNRDNEGEEKIVTETQRIIARLAALLHDIGNIPFGHTLEDETHVISSYQEDLERYNRYLTPETEVGKVLCRQLSEPELNLLKNILTAKKDPLDGKIIPKEKYISDLGPDAFIVDIIKNTVCADLIDYLMRDTYFCGLPLSVPDRFLSYLYIHTKENNEKRLAIRLWKKDHSQPKRSLISELVQLLETRYFLAERVYFHHTKQIASAMIAAATWDAKIQQSNAKLFEEELLSIGDEMFLNKLLSYPINSPAHKIINDYERRKLYTPIYILPKTRLNDNDGQISYLESAFHKDPENRHKTEMQMCELIGLEPGDIIIYCPNPKMNLKIAEMKVSSSTGISNLCDVADALTEEKINSIIESHKQLWGLQVFVKSGLIISKLQEDIIRSYCMDKFESIKGEQGESINRQLFRDLIHWKESENQAIAIDMKTEDRILEELITVYKSEGNNLQNYNEMIDKKIKECLKINK
jgi:HD superfamily phosphohydrolase